MQAVPLRSYVSTNGPRLWSLRTFRLASISGGMMVSVMADAAIYERIAVHIVLQSNNR